MTESPLQLLVVDDDSVDRAALRRALAKAGVSAEIREAATVEEALDALTRERYDCAFLDYHLPGGSGIDVLRTARSRGVATPVVMLTGRGDEELAVELMKAGATDYLPKGTLTPERIRRALAYARRVHEAEAQAAEAEAALRTHAENLRALSEAALAITSSLSLEEMLQVVAHQAREIVGCRWAWVSLDAHPGAGGDEPQRVVVSSDDDEPPPDSLGEHLSVALVNQDSTAMGAVAVAGKECGEIDAQDEAILTQLARLASVAVQNARLYRAAQEATAARESVLAVVSHDLRNPLGAISNSTAVLEATLGAGRTEEIADRSRRSLEIIRRSTRQMSRLVDDLLDVSRIEQGRLDLDREAVLVEPLLEEVATLVAGKQSPDDERRVRIVHRVEAGLPPASGDRWRLLQALGNLVANAVRHSPDDGVVEVLARRASGGERPQIRFAVVDSGPGIDPGFLPDLFEPFKQSPSSQGGGIGRPGGAGLGLAIVRGIVEAHEGKIWVESAPGEGASFYFTVPVAAGSTVLAAE